MAKDSIKKTRGSIYAERGLWIIDYQDSSGIRRRETADTRRAAARLLRLRLAQMRADTFRPSMLRERADHRRSVRMKKNWKIPGYSNRISSAMVSALARPDTCKKKSAAGRANWTKPEYSKAVLA